MLLRKNFDFLFISVSTFICLVFQHATNLQSKATHEQNFEEIVKVSVNNKVIELTSTWDKRIWFFTSADNPITSLDGLNVNEIACFGAEHWNRFFDFLDAAGIKYKERSMNLTSPNLVEFKNTQNPIRLYITWSKYKSQLKGAVRVEFVKKETFAFKDTSKIKIDGLFYLNNESLPVWLVPQATGMWGISFETAKQGAHAKVKMEDGSTVNLSFTMEPGRICSLNVKTEKSTYTVRKLPDGSISLVLLSKQLFADRFKLAVILKGPNNFEIFFIEPE